MDLENLFEALEETFDAKTREELNNTDDGMFVTI